MMTFSNRSRVDDNNKIASKARYGRSRWWHVLATIEEGKPVPTLQDVTYCSP